MKMGIFDYSKNNQNALNTQPNFATDQNETYNSVDPDQYFIGGGDVFKITIIGNSSIQYTATINQQCELFISELGIKKLGKVCLTEAQKQIIEFVQTKLKKANDIHVDLIKAKRVTASINGAITGPGTYSLPGTSRILDAIRQANNGMIPSMNECNLREIQCTSQDSITTIDLFGYLFKNDMACNPYLYPCENINVSFATRRVYVNAPLKMAVTGWIPIKEKETLFDFLSYLKFDASADTTMIFFQSSISDNSRSSRSISYGETSSIVLQDRDIITIPSKKNYAPVIFVNIGGEVAQPGLYPIIKDSTTIENVLKIAGGITQYADLSRAVIVRRSKVDERFDSLKSFQNNNLPNTNNITTVRPEMNTGLSKMNATKDYAIIDLESAGMSVKLFANDNIIVPPIDHFIYISGDVKKSGAYQYISGKSYRYYIALAGGYTGKADKSNVFGVRNFGTFSQITDLSEIRAADVIVVPDSQQAKFLTNVFLPILQTSATIVSVFLAIYSLSHTTGK